MRNIYIQEGRIEKNNRKQNIRARDYLARNLDAYVYAFNGNITKASLLISIPMKNFSWDFAVPRRNETIEELLKEYRAFKWEEKNPSKRMMQLINRIFRLVDKTGGIHFNWI